MLRQTHTMHHGFVDHAALSWPAFGAMVGELCFVMGVSDWEVELDGLLVVWVFRITLTMQCRRSDIGQLRIVLVVKV